MQRIWCLQGQAALVGARLSYRANLLLRRLRSTSATLQNARGSITILLPVLLGLPPLIAPLSVRSRLLPHLSVEAGWRGRFAIGGILVLQRLEQSIPQ
jgi:hypothetical protein